MAAPASSSDLAAGEVGTDFLAEAGHRLTRIRGSESQQLAAGRFGVHKNTWGSYERGEREMTAGLLARIAAAGWNVNWLLTGQGPERLNASASSSSTVIESAAASQSKRAEALSMAIELIDDRLAAHNRRLPPRQLAEAYLLVAELLLEPGDSLPSAKVIELALRAAKPE